MEEARVCGAEARSSPFGGGKERRAAEEEMEWGLGFGSRLTAAPLKGRGSGWRAKWAVVLMGPAHVPRRAGG